MKRLMIVAALAALLCGCTTYHVTRPDGTTLHVQSWREFPGGIDVDYESAEGAKLKIKAGEVRSADPAADIVARALDVLIQRQAPKSE